MGFLYQRTINPVIAIGLGIVCLLFGQWASSATRSAQASATPLASMSVARFDLALAASGGKLYAIGGLGHDGLKRLVEEYDPATNQWTVKTPMPTARRSLAAAAGPDGKIYVMGGLTGSFTSDIVATVEAYDPATDTWEVRRSMTSARYGLAATFASNGKLYVIGGGESAGAVSTVEAYDPATDSWTPRGSMVMPRGAHGAAALGGKIYAMGGGSYSAHVEEYDVGTDVSTPKASMSTPRGFLGAAAWNGKVYAIGGYNGSGTAPGLAIVEEFDPVADSWVRRTDMPTARQSPAVAELNGVIYAVGGLGGSGGNIPFFSTLEAYTPATHTWSPEGTAPVTDSLSIAGTPVTSSTSVALSITARDIGSGLAEMSFSNNGTTWSPWQPFMATTGWTLSEGDGTKVVHARTRDQVGNVSAPVTATISLDMSPPQLSAVKINGGAVDSSSTTVVLALQASEPSSGSGVAAMSFSNDGGGSWSAWEPYTSTKSWLMSAGDGPKTVHARVRDAAGNISPAASDGIILDTTVGTNFGVSINDAAVWTNSVAVELSLPAAPGTAKMQISNDGGFAGAPWEPYSANKNWILDRFEGSPVTMIVYARFGDASNNELPNSRSSDNIVLDIEPPTGSLTVGGGSTSSATERHTDSPVRLVQLTATDNQSGAGMQMRLSNRPDFAGAIWKPFASSVSWDFTGGAAVHAQFRDGAGNLSQTYSQTVPGGPPAGTSPAPGCSPRPAVTVNLQKSNGTLIATVSTTGTNNGLRAVRFDSFTNALVDVGSQQNQTTSFAVSIPPGQEPTSLQFAVRRLPGNPGTTTVRLVIIDGCGEWSTFVGGGPNAF